MINTNTETYYTEIELPYDNYDIVVDVECQYFKETHTFSAPYGDDAGLAGTWEDIVVEDIDIIGYHRVFNVSTELSVWIPEDGKEYAGTVGLTEAEIKKIKDFAIMKCEENGGL
tara:strand:- start:162 stop:503 length:342 start_codon:yes stop_codon:yes gene_type:complete